MKPSKLSPGCLKRCMPSNDLSSLLLNSSSFSECGSLSSVEDMMLYLDDDSTSSHYKRQRMLSDPKMMVNDCCPATDALEAALLASAVVADELLAFEIDLFDPTSVLHVPGGSGCGYHHGLTAATKAAVAQVTGDFARLNTKASRSA